MNPLHALTLKRKLAFPSVRDGSLRDHVYINVSHMEISTSMFTHCDSLEIKIIYQHRE